MPPEKDDEGKPLEAEAEIQPEQAGEDAESDYLAVLDAAVAEVSDGEADAPDPDAEKTPEETKAEDVAEETPAEAKAETPEAATDDDAKDDPKDRDTWLSDKEFRDLPEKAQGRIRDLDRRFKAAREEAVSLKDGADRMDRIADFCTENKVTPDDFTRLMDYGALLRKGEYKAALEAIQPQYEFLMQATGKEVHPDLSRKVDDGEMTREQALDQQASKMRADHAEARAQAAEAQVQEGTAARQADEARAQMVTAVEETVRGIAASDPGFQGKQDAITRYVEQRVAAAPPVNAEQAKAVVMEAYKFVSDLTPAKPATMPRPPASPPNTALPAEQSYDDVFDTALARAR